VTEAAEGYRRYLDIAEESPTPSPSAAFDTGIVDARQRLAEIDLLVARQQESSVDPAPSTARY
jgi:hypothetical protein